MKYNIYGFQLSSKIRFYIRSLMLFVLFLGGMGKSYAVLCEPLDHSPIQFVFNFAYSVTDGSKNQAGQEFDNVSNWNLGGGKQATCDCPAGQKYQTVYWTTVTNLPVGHTSGQKTFYSVNDYLEVSSMIYMGGTVQNYEDTPLNSFLTPVGTPGGDPCSFHQGGAWSDGYRGKISLYIKKAFVGTVQIPTTELFMLYADTAPNMPPAGNGFSRVSMSGTVVVPQTCTLNAGQIVNIDFGDIWSGKFKTKGQKPDGINAKTVTFPVTCNGGVESTANLTVRFQSTPDANYPDAISSDNPDVGVVITDMNGRTIEPNTGLIPFSLENSQATVSFKAYPVSTTGKAPTEGKFTSLAYIRVDFA